MYTKDESSEVKATNMDEQLKMLAVQNWTAAIDFSIQGNMEACFHAYKSLYHLIEPYEFENKGQLRELTECLTNFTQDFKSSNAGKINRQTKVKLAKQMYSFEHLLGIYMSELPKAYHSLNLWFRSITTNIDYDVTISQKNFNTEYTGISKKRGELEKNLDVKAVLDLLTINDIHKIYAKWRYDIHV